MVEGGGGGQTYESYELAAGYFLKAVEVARNVKPVLVFIGDEMPYDRLNADQLMALGIRDASSSMNTEELFKQLAEVYDVYLIHKPYGNSPSGTTKEVAAVWEKLLPENHVVPLQAPERVVDVLFGILANATVPLWLDAKGRQLRVEESISHKDHLELVLNHEIQGLDLPHPIIFKAGEDWATVEKITDGGKRLHCQADGYPKYRVKPGDSIHFRNPKMTISDSLFTVNEKEKIEKAVKLGHKNFYLSYVESSRDVAEFRELVGRDATIILKIESQKGLAFVHREFECNAKFPNTYLACARGDLYVEVQQPHHILAAQKLIVTKDPDAIVGSRMLLSLFNNTVPACSDVCELGLLKTLGYKNFLLCDDLCKKGPALHRAVDTFAALRYSVQFG